MPPFWKSRKRDSPRREEQFAFSGEESTCVDVDYLNLEPRRVLSADFTLIGGMLELDNFSEANDENLTIGQTSSNLLSFTLDEGNWSGLDNANLFGNGTNTLIADPAFLTSIDILDSQAIALDTQFRGVDLSGVDSVSVITTGDIDQNIFFSMVAPDLHLAGNSIDLNHPANDFGTVSLESTTSASLTDFNSIEISSADIGDKLEVNSAGIDLTGNISSDQIRFHSSQGVSQAVSTSIITNGIVLTGAGNFTLDSQLNELNNIAGTVNGNIEVDVLNDVNISSLTCGGRTFCGISASGDLDITSIEGDITQDVSASLFVGGDAVFTAEDGNICLDGGDCNGDGINDNVIVGQASFVASGDSAFAANGDIELGNVSGVNVRFSADNIAFNSNIAASSLVLEASAGVASLGNEISTDELLLLGRGNFNLASPANSIQSIAADIAGNLQLATNGNLIIGTLAHVSCAGGVTLCGLQVSGNVDVTLENGNFSQNAAARIGGDLTIDAGGGDVCLSGGDCDGDGINDNNFDTVNIVAANDVEVADIDGLAINSLEANRAAVIAGQSAPGQIAIEGNLVVAEQLLLQASDGVDQVTGSIATSELLLDGSGSFLLDDPANAFSFVAANIAGSLDFAASTDVTIGSLEFESNCRNASVVICGLNVDGDLDIYLENSDLKQTSAVVVAGLTTIEVGTGDVCFSGGDCDGDGVNDNDFNEVRVFSANDVEIADVNDIVVEDFEVQGDGAIIAGQSTEGKITLDGDIVTGDRLLLQASNGVEQLSSSIRTNDLVLDGTGNFHLCFENQIGSSTSAGRISADVTGDVYIDNRYALELVDQQFTTISGVLIAHNQFNVGENLTIVSDAANSNAIFDSTQINVDGESYFRANGNRGNVALDELNVASPIGIFTSAGNAIVVNQHAVGIVFRNDDLPDAPANETCAHFEQSIVNGDLIAQATSGNITNESNSTLIVNGTATLIAGTTNSSNITGSNNEFNIELGLEADDNVQIDILSANANQASIALDRSVSFSDTAIGVPSQTDANDGTLFLKVSGSVTQPADILLSADRVAIDASEYIFLDDIDADQVAFRANGFLDTSTTTTPTDLPIAAEDRFAPRHTSVDTQYGIIVSSQNDIEVTTIEDTLGRQQNLTGIAANNGHAFLQTTGDGNIHFDGRGNNNTFGTTGSGFGLASDMQNGHVLTTIAGGNLTIAENTVLRSTTGAVTDISSFNTDEGVNFENVTKEGPLFSLFLPTPSDDPTTKTVNTDDSQFIGLNFGRTNELNFIVEVAWADGTLDVLNFDTDIGNRFERISHTFTNKFLTETFELPTFLDFFNDPAINLFDNNGQTNLNSTTDLNTNDNFVLAFSDSRPQGDLEIASVSKPAAVIRESSFTTNDDQVASETEVSEFGTTETVTDDEASDAYLVRLDDTGFEIKDTRQDLDDSSVTQDVIAELKQRVEEGTEYPPGQYRINWTESGVSFSIEFEKGAEEDLDPAELEPVVDESTPPEEAGNDLPTGESANGPELETSDLPQRDVNLHEASPVLIRGANIEPQTAHETNNIREDVDQPSRAGLIAAGALALGLKRRNAKQSEEFIEELSKLGAEENKISFLKSARSSRRIGG